MPSEEIAPLTILLVDDSATSRLYFEELLTSMGYCPVLASNGREALHFMDQGGVDLVLCDLVMPDMDGLEVLKTMQELAFDIPFLLITQHASMATAIRGLKEGALDYIARPVEPEILETRIKSAAAKFALRKQHEENQRLEAALATIGAVAHELTQPLQAVMGLAELLAETTEPDKLKQRSSKIVSEVGRLGEIIHRLGNLTAYKTKPYVLDRCILDLEASTPKKR